jgi:hypothetical protein
MNKHGAILAVALALAAFSIPAFADCEDGHWIKSVSSDGEIVLLEDGSVWQVDSADAIDSALWLPTTNIVACDDKLINTDDGETVEAVRIH